MAEMRNMAMGLVIFAVLAVLYVGIYDGLVTGYGITKTTKEVNISGTITTGNIAEQFQQLTLLKGLADLQAGIAKLAPPAGADTDILGGLAAVGIGALGIIAGLVITPVQIINIVVGYYAGSTPAVIAQLIFGLVSAYIGFVLLSAYLKKDV